MTNFDLTPKGSSSPVVRFYGEAVEALTRTQTENVAKNGVLNQGRPDAHSLSLDPGEVVLRGFWAGTEASGLATRLRDSFIDDETVTDVRLDGQSTTTEFDGDYKLSDRSEVKPAVPTDDRLWEFEVRLTEI